ncbi:PREDICTED: mediator of RNA polymerase II transcription subunit 15 isoform X2 [Brassica oleracea var. oleracea]|uniref:mediator of RNA polymerase II transcription subunit 15 isoform X2 n=1 Tax=Brassica oleracea var. oleracea TaxID=109376 RepID=UPI0006A6A464|nr:PREDICTED: mediator of RNA polymerase II transcription subunit 15 isoform X2 [Brassica oleracea var. oleracea]
MECNKDEAIRAMDIAKRKVTENDYTGAKTFAVKAQNLYPELDGLKQVLMLIDVYISAGNKINGGEPDWYGVLGVDPLADDGVVKKQYRKLALLLHPDKNKCEGAEGAFKLILEAWSLLSDKVKRIAFDQKRRVVMVKEVKPRKSRKQKQEPKEPKQATKRQKQQAKEPKQPAKKQKQPPKEPKQPKQPAKQQKQPAKQQEQQQQPPKEPKQEANQQQQSPMQPKQEANEQNEPPKQPRQPANQQEQRPKQPKQEANEEQQSPMQPKQEANEQNEPPKQPRQPANQQEQRPKQPKQEANEEQQSPMQPKQEANGQQEPPKQPKQPPLPKQPANQQEQRPNQQKQQPSPQKQQQRQPSSKASRNGRGRSNKPTSKVSTFWTKCNICETQHEYIRVYYLNKKVICRSCHGSFKATEIDKTQQATKDASCGRDSLSRKASSNVANQAEERVVVEESEDKDEEAAREITNSDFKVEERARKKLKTNGSCRGK